MDGSKGAFSLPYCMCGPTFEVNIHCLLPVLPAVSHSSSFVFARMRPHSNWPHQNCLFLLLNKHNIALGPQLKLIWFSKDSIANIDKYAAHFRNCPVEKKSTVYIFFQRIWKWNFHSTWLFFFLMFLIRFKSTWYVKRISPVAKFKPGPKSGHSLIQWFNEFVHKCVLTSVIRVANVIHCNLIVFH